MTTTNTQAARQRAQQLLDDIEQANANIQGMADEINRLQAEMARIGARVAVYQGMLSGLQAQRDRLDELLQQELALLEPVPALPAATQTPALGGATHTRVGSRFVPVNGTGQS